MTIPGLLMLNPLVGASVAYASRIQLRTLQRGVLFSRYFVALLLLEGLVLVPAGSYLAFLYPDWSWMYLLDTSRTSAAVSIMAILAYPFAAALGFLIGYYAARSSSDWVTVMFMAFSVAGFAGLFVVAEDKMLWVGTFAQYHRNAGMTGILRTSLFPSIVLAASGITVCWGNLIYRFVLEGRLSLRSS